MEQVDKNVKEREDDEIENVCFEKRYIQIFKLYLCRTFCGLVNFDKNIKTYWHEIKTYNWS